MGLLRGIPATDSSRQHTRRLIDSFTRLERIHRHFDDAAKELEAARCAAVCVEGCGLCCQENTPFVWGLEARHMMSYLLGNGGLEQAMQAAEAWLLDKVQGVTSYGAGTSPRPLAQNEWNGLRGEVTAAIRAPCPFLLDDKQCAIHQFRPIACRAYGVTRLPSPKCMRRLGVTEDARRMMYYGGPGAEQLQREVRDLLAVAPAEWRPSMFLPTVLLSLGKPDRFKTLLDNNQIASAKLVAGVSVSPNVLWQSQLEVLWRESVQTPS